MGFSESPEIIATLDWLQAWVADDLDGYVRNAVALAADPLGLAHVRSHLRPVMKASPLMDARRFAREFEDVLLERWQRLFGSEKGL